LLAGCGSGPAAIRPPSFEPDEAAAEAVTLYDSNGDGQLEKSEWSKSPALAVSIDIYDTERDSSLSAAEIAAGLRRWQAGEMGATSLPFQVRYQGRGLEGATVHLIPEPFLAKSVKAASGTSGRGGRGYLGIAPADLPADAPRVPMVQPGLYRVEISHPSVPIPERYNSKTTLGIEVAQDRVDPGGVVWTLTK
jgi:hypothetical protein